MYTDKKNVLQTVALLKAYQIRHIVLCPGSRNIPLVQAFAQNRAFACYSITDERSAGFFAIGLAEKWGEPVAVCCTSGSALLNLHPAVAEAFYRHLPLIILSADRPAAWIGQMDGQTLPQPGVFGTLVRQSVNLPEVHTAEDEWFCNRMLNEILLDMNTPCADRQPIHINIPISEPFFHFPVEELPHVRTIRHIKGCTATDIAIREAFRRYPKIMFIGGQSSATAMNFPDTLRGYLWLAEHLTNNLAPANAVRQPELLLKMMNEEDHDTLRPDLVVTYGGHILSKPLKKYLRQYPPQEHWHLRGNGSEMPDLFGALTCVFDDSIEHFVAHLPSAATPQKEYADRWKTLETALPAPTFPYSEMAAIGQLIGNLPPQSVLHLANSSTVRYAQLFSLSPEIEVHANRGVNGIEGSMSTAVGYAATDNRLNFIAIGDLSFFYDMNALWCPYMKENLRILLLNNSGGEIFNALPGLNLDETAERYIMAPHTTSARAWAKERGFCYRPVSGPAQLEEAIEWLTSPSPAPYPLFAEVFTRREEDIEHLKAYYRKITSSRTNRKG